MQTIVTFNNFFDTGCLKFKFLDNIIAGCFSKLFSFGGKSYNFEKAKTLCSSQGSVMTFSTVLDKYAKTNVVFRILCTKNYVNRFIFD